MKLPPGAVDIAPRGTVRRQFPRALECRRPAHIGTAPRGQYMRGGAPSRIATSTPRAHGHHPLGVLHPAPERLLGPRTDRGGVLGLLTAAPTPEALRQLGEDGITAAMRTRSPRLARTLPRQILAALHSQTVVVPGTAAFGRVIGGLAAQLNEVRTERDALAAELEAHPLAEVLTSMPGLGFRTAPKILTIVGDGSAFPTAGHLAAYAGLAPVTRRSATSIKGETRSQRGNHALTSALFLSAFASLADPTSRAYYDRKRAQGERHDAALICPARRRTDVIYALLRDRTPYQPPAPAEPDSQPAAA